MFSDITSRLVSVEQRLVTLELKATDHDSALNDLTNRVMGLQSTLDDASTVVVDAPDRDRVEAYLKEIETVKAEARSAICAANDVEQYTVAGIISEYEVLLWTMIVELQLCHLLEINYK